MSLNVLELEPTPLTGRSFHASTIIRNKVYLHGGIKDYATQLPSNDIIVFDSNENKVFPISTKTAGPSRSHHTASALKNKFMCIVGGWDGKKRTTDIWLFDVDLDQWTMLTPTPLSNPPAGLSSHTCTLVDENEMIITGREGGVRMQRRFGSVFKLKVTIAKQNFSYVELHYHIASRSGHTACLLYANPEAKLKKSANVVIMGGRDSSTSDVIKISTAMKPINEDLAYILRELINVKSKLFTVCKSRALRHHTVVAAGELSLIQGGEVFGKVRDTIISDFFIHDVSGSKWWQANISRKTCPSLKRMGHSILWLSGKLFIIGGVLQQNIIANTILEITISR